MSVVGRLGETDGREFHWRLEPHACRICFARLVSRRTVGGKRVIRCTNCGTEIEHPRIAGLCCCGITLSTGRNAGVRCIHNPKRTPECPSEIVVQAAEMPAGALAPIVDDLENDDG